jgi:gamma-glutamyl-gamma-aminobutyrate hydrolase PuuD
MARAFLFLLLLPLSALAEVGLLQWQPSGYDYSFVLPQKQGEAPSAAVERYLSSLEKNPELRPFARSLRATGAGMAGGVLRAYDGTGAPAVLALANALDDLEARPARMHRVLDPLAERGARPFLAPVAVTAGLSEKGAEQFRKKVNASFDGLVAVGGDDIHPSLYNDPDPRGLAVHTNRSRDVEELKLVRSWLEEGRGVFSGICRGHQMGGVASSCPLVKDIREELTLSHPRHQDHGIRMLDGEAGRLTRDVFDGSSVISVTSNHHQAIAIPDKPSPRLRITAVADGQPRIAEIAEYYGRRGFSVQSHPEDMTSSAFHARFYDVLYGEVDRAHARRTSRPFQRIDLGRTLFGVEYTFQDQGMVDEPGRLTFETPHKRARFNAFRQAYMRELGLSEQDLGRFGSQSFKPGHTLEARDGRHVMNMEPVTIEVNTPPKHFDEIESAAEKIYRASRQASLVPYVNPAAERSGMGHIHVGGKVLGDSPFYRNPHLLRNMMVYLHKHPSLLWGFAEAYDIGQNSNIETYHSQQRQQAFGRAVAKFDSWYQRTLAKNGDLSDGLRQFIGFLREEDGLNIQFFHHYRLTNLEHLRFLTELDRPANPRKAGKATVEFRNFRPPKSPQHAKAHAELLLALMERLSEPGHLEKFESVSPAAYERFHSATRVAADWELVKRDLPRYNPLWDDSVGEYVRLQTGREAIRARLPQGMRAEIFPAYSRKDDKGTKFEIRLPVDSYEPPRLALGGATLEFERVQLGGREFWVSTFDTTAVAGLRGQDVAKFGQPAFCSRWFQVLR